MTIKFVKQIQIIDSNNMTNYKDLKTLPDYCPVCNKGISPQFLIMHFINPLYKQLVCKCPVLDCQEIFIASYSPTYAGSTVLGITHLSPKTKIEKDFNEEILNLSPSFIKIYNQAYVAEQEGLDLICGVGYRKALEYLIKDYAIKKNPDESEKIKALLLAQCINKYIENESIKEMSKYAVWIGNDETHFVRRWDDKDLNDLKQLIKLTVHYISMEILTEKYQIEMKK